VGNQAGVLGRPITHSLSPVLHRAAYAELGLDWTYDAIDCGVAELPAVLASRSGWAGFSATMPLKHALLDIAAEVRPLARAVGAANTLLPGAHGWVADNTDVAGVLGALAEHGVAADRVTVLGAGGTAQAVLAAVQSHGVAHCTILVRDPARTASARDTAARVGIELTIGQLDVAAPALGAGLVVSTLPPGAADPLAPRDWRADQAVLDVAYAPWPSALAAAAELGGATVISGAVMLLHQAAEQVRLMTGQVAPVEAMRAALDFS
jgi:shikimate dehydrogenase